MKVKEKSKWKKLREIFRKIDNNEDLTCDEQGLLESEAEFWCKMQIYVTIPISLLSIILSIVAITLR